MPPFMGIRNIEVVFDSRLPITVAVQNGNTLGAAIDPPPEPLVPAMPPFNGQDCGGIRSLGIQQDKLLDLYALPSTAKEKNRRMADTFPCAHEAAVFEKSRPPLLLFPDDQRHGGPQGGYCRVRFTFPQLP